MISIELSFIGCIILTLIMLTVLGVYLAKISDESMIRYGFQMLIVGMVTAFLCVLSSVLLGGHTMI